MNDKQQLEHFVTLLTQSGLPDERIRYWVDRVYAPDFTEEDEKAFTREMEEHLIRIDEAIGVTEEDILDLEKKKTTEEYRTLPYLEKLADAQEEAQKKERDAYKSELSEAEKKALDQIEKLRLKAGEEEIESIRKRLGNS